MMCMKNRHGYRERRTQLCGKTSGTKRGQGQNNCHSNQVFPVSKCSYRRQWVKEETGPILLSLKQPCSLSVRTGDSGSKKRQAPYNSHFHSCVLFPGPTVDSGTTQREAHYNRHRVVFSLSIFLYLSLFSWQLFYLEMEQVVFL